MFHFWKSDIEKKLLALGHQDSIAYYKQQLRQKKISKAVYMQYLQDLLAEQKSKLSNIGNVNVATRQSFADDEILIPLNVSKIQQPEYDIDFIKNKIAFDFKNNQRLYANEIRFLFDFFKTEFSEFLSDQNKTVAKHDHPADFWVNLICGDYTPQNAPIVFQAFQYLLLKK